MKTVVVYESMYGNTHRIAEELARVAAERGDAVCVAVDSATPEVLSGADLVLVGGPTHAHGISSSTSRHGAVADASKHHLTLDPAAEGAGLRDWFDTVVAVPGTMAAAFDTRVDASAVLTGRASKGIDKRLRHHGFTVVAEPESFLVDRHTSLVDGETEHARRWATELLDRVTDPS